MLRHIALSLFLVVAIPAFAAQSDKQDQKPGTQQTSGQQNQTNTKGYSCGLKTKCDQMTSCEEATYYLKTCAISSLDRDKDGTPCESLCKKK